MDTLQLLGLAGAAIAGGLVGAASCYWSLSRVIVQLRLRLERSEKVRAGAVESSVQAREQIAQLNRAIAALRRAHSHRAVHDAAREPTTRELAERE